MIFPPKAFLLLALLLASPTLRAADDGAPTAPHALRWTVRAKSVSNISPLLFGQFLERNSGETGPEAALTPGTSELRPDVAAKLAAMRVPVIRFPGGTLIDFSDWRDLISRVPGRKGEGRPDTTYTRETRTQTVTNRFGFDEYFRQVRDPSGCQTDLVLNFLDAVANRKPIHEAAIDACGLLAYVNSPQGAKLPPGMPDWPTVRAANGHPEPYRTDYIQIGNETWIPNFWKVAKAAWPDKTDAELAAYYHACLNEYVRVIREIDPKIPIVIDLRMPFGAAMEVYADPFILQNVNVMAYHVYQPGRLTGVGVEGKIYDAEQFTPDDLWAYWSMLPAWTGAGPVDHIPRDEPGLRAGLKIACTEWNWLRFGDGGPGPKVPFHWTVPAALGVARNLHGMIRASGRMAFATQSMLIGSKWNFASIFFDPDTPGSAHFSVQGQVTDFYRRTMGAELLPLDFMHGLETLSFALPGGAETVSAGAAVDPIASRDGKRVLLHIINRYWDAPATAAVRFEGFGALPGEAQLQLLSRDLTLPGDIHADPLTLTSETVTLQGNTASLLLARPGIYVLELRLP